MRRALHLDSGEAGGLPRNLPQRLLPRGLPPLLGQNLHSHLLAGLPIHSPARPAPPVQRPRPQNHGLRRTESSRSSTQQAHSAHGAGMPNPKDLGDAGQNHPSRTEGARDLTCAPSRRPRCPGWSPVAAPQLRSKWPRVRIAAFHPGAAQQQHRRGARGEHCRRALQQGARAAARPAAATPRSQGAARTST